MPPAGLGPRFPVSGPRFPPAVPAERETGDFPIPAESGIGDSLPLQLRAFPAKSARGMGGTGIGDFRVWWGLAP